MLSSVFFFPWKSVPVKAIFGPFSVFFTDGKFFSRTLFHAQFVFSRALFNIFSRVWLFFSRTENWKFSRTGFCFHGQKFWLFFVLFFFHYFKAFFWSKYDFLQCPPPPPGFLKLLVFLTRTIFFICFSVLFSGAFSLNFKSFLSFLLLLFWRVFIISRVFWAAHWNIYIFF